MRKLLLFDLDGTLTKARKELDMEMKEILIKAKKIYSLAIVSGSDYEKIKYQLGNSLSLFDFIFSENGTVSFNNKNQVINKTSIVTLIGESLNNKLINFCLKTLSAMFCLGIGSKKLNFFF